MIVPTRLESGNHLGVVGERRKDAQLKLGIININKNTTLGSTEETAEFGIGRNILQVRIGAGVTPGDRPSSMQLAVQPPVDDMIGKHCTKRGKTTCLLGARMQRLDK